MAKHSNKELSEIARKTRRLIIEMIYNAKSGHLGGSLSEVEILVALYYEIMNIRPTEPDWPDRDRLVLSKGHTAPALYAILAEKGYFSEELLFSQYRRINSILQGHPDVNKTPGIDMSAGSLGIGLSTACGMALGAKKAKKGFKVYAVLGDGELNEGEIWEAAMFASCYSLDNLTAFIDVNKMQNDGLCSDVMNMGDIEKKWDGFGWNTEHVADGNSADSIVEAVNRPKAANRPTAIICETIKGKGVSFMENQIRFHGGCPSAEEYKAAMEELRN